MGKCRNDVGQNIVSTLGEQSSLTNRHPVDNVVFLKFSSKYTFTPQRVFYYNTNKAVQALQ